MGWIILTFCFINILRAVSSQGCTAAPEVGNATVTPDLTNYNENDTVVYFCLHFFVMTGDPSLSCSNGTWEGIVPSCDLLNCSDVTPPSLSDGYYTGTFPYMGGDTLEYSCNTNFVISGNTILTCDNSTNTTWIGELPVCTPVCPQPNALSNAFINSDPPYYKGTYARYICHAHYVMTGDSYLTCGADYQWHGVEPVCTAYEQEEVTYTEETLVFDTANDDTNKAARLAAIILGLLFGLLLLLLLILLILRFCCGGSRCASCCFGDEGGGCCKCKKNNDLHPDTPRKETKLQIIESEEIDEPMTKQRVERQAQVIRSPEVFQAQPQPVPQPQESPPRTEYITRSARRERFQLAVNRVLGLNRKNKVPKQIEGKWMPHANNVRGNHLTSTK